MTTTTAPARVATSRPRAVRSDKWSRRAPLLPALLFTIVVTQVPFLLTVWYSLQSWNLVRPGSEHFVGVSNYIDVFADSTFRSAALNTIVLTGSCVVIAMLLGIGIAMLLDREFLGRGVVRTLLITPFLVMPVAACAAVEDHDVRPRLRHRQLRARAVRCGHHRLDLGVPAGVGDDGRWCGSGRRS